MYSKIFDSMYDGTLRTRSPWQALVTFQQMLILSDPTGLVDMTPEAIAHRTGIPLEHIQTGIAALELPDPESRSPACEGRRIVRLSDSRSWGWRLTNYEAYRAIRDAEDRREYQRFWAREDRARKKGDGASTGKVDKSRQSTNVDSVDRSRPKQSQKQKKSKPLVRSNDTIAPAPPDGFAAFWAAWPPSKRKVDRKACAAKWKSRGFEDLADQIIAHVEVMKLSRQWRDGYEPAPETYLNNERWGDPLPPDIEAPEERAWD